MKTRVVVLLCSFLLGVGDQARAQGFWKQLGRVVVSSLPKVDSPFLRQMGWIPHGATIAIVQNTPFHARLVAGNRELARLGPGDLAYDTRRFEWQIWPQIPLLMFFYRDPAMTQYVGVAGRIFTVQSGYPSAETWIVSLGDIQTPDGTWLQQGYGQPVYPAPDTALAAKAVRLPREWWNGTLGAQIVNNTLFTMHPRVNGLPRGDVPPGGAFLWLHIRELLTGGHPLGIQLVFTDRGRWVGSHEFPAFVPSGDVRAHQEIVGPSHIRR